MKILQDTGVSLYGLIWKKLGLVRFRPFQDLFSLAYFEYKRRYEDPFSNFMAQHPTIFSGGHILDIGANIGYTATLFSKGIRRGSHVIAFEPEEHNFNVLKRNIRHHDLLDKVIPVHAAVGEQNGHINLWVNPTHPGDHRILTQHFSKELGNGPEQQHVPVWSVDGYLKDHRLEGPISFIKIDVQGYELPVCQGMPETLQANPDAVIAVEYYPAAMHALGFDPATLFGFFEARQFRVYLLTLEEGLKNCSYEDLKRMVVEEDIDLIFSRQSLVSTQALGASST